MRNSVLKELSGRRFADKPRPDLLLQGQGEMKDGGGKSLNGSYTSKGSGKKRIGIGEETV